MKAKPIRSQWAYSILVHGFRNQSAKDSATVVKAYRHQRLKQMVLSTLYANFSPSKPCIKDGEERHFV